MARAKGPGARGGQGRQQDPMCLELKCKFSHAPRVGARGRAPGSGAARQARGPDQQNKFSHTLLGAKASQGARAPGGGARTGNLESKSKRAGHDTFARHPGGQGLHSAVVRAWIFCVSHPPGVLPVWTCGLLPALSPPTA